MSTSHKAFHLSGRCRSGRDQRGIVYHAVPAQAEAGSFTAAVCGKQPAGLSAGWGSDPQPVSAVTCPRCQRRLAR